MVDYSDYNARKNGTYEQKWVNTGKCVFCDLRDKYIVKRGKTCVLTVNLFPYTDGHLMIIPLRHIEKLSDFSDEETLEVKSLTDFATKILKEKLGVDDIWFLYRNATGVKAGKTVTHAHFHVIPYVADMFVPNFSEIKIPPLELASKLR